MEIRGAATALEASRSSQPRLRPGSRAVFGQIGKGAGANRASAMVGLRAVAGRCGAESRFIHFTSTWATSILTLR